MQEMFFQLLCIWEIKLFLESNDTQIENKDRNLNVFLLKMNMTLYSITLTSLVFSSGQTKSALFSTQTTGGI